MTIDRAIFRNAMARFGAAVSVITTDGVGGRCGLTCTAICSITDDPASVLVCVHRDSRCNEVLKLNQVFCINLLHADHRDISALFAGQAGPEMADRFAKIDWKTLETGCPVLDEAAAVLDCDVVEVKEFGTHTILFGRVRGVEFDNEKQPLMYFNRSYQGLSPVTNPVIDQAAAAR